MTDKYQDEDGISISYETIVSCIYIIGLVSILAGLTCVVFAFAKTLGVFVVATGISAVISGVVMFGLASIIQLLIEIRDAVKK